MIQKNIIARLDILEKKMMNASHIPDKSSNLSDEHLNSSKDAWNMKSHCKYHFTPFPNVPIEVNCKSLIANTNANGLKLFKDYNETFDHSTNSMSIPQKDLNVIENRYSSIIEKKNRRNLRQTDYFRGVEDGQNWSR